MVTMISLRNMFILVGMLNQCQVISLSPLSPMSYPLLKIYSVKTSPFFALTLFQLEILEYLLFDPQTKFIFTFRLLPTFTYPYILSMNNITQQLSSLLAQ